LRRHRHHRLRFLDRTNSSFGAFATYVTGTNGGSRTTRTFDDETLTFSSSGSPHGWGGGMDFTYFFPWKYAGARFQGAGVELSTQTVTVTTSTG